MIIKILPKHYHPYGPGCINDACRRLLEYCVERGAPIVLPETLTGRSLPPDYTVKPNEAFTIEPIWEPDGGAGPSFRAMWGDDARDQWIEDLAKELDAFEGERIFDALRSRRDHTEAKELNMPPEGAISPKTGLLRDLEATEKAAQAVSGSLSALEERLAPLCIEGGSRPSPLPAPAVRPGPSTGDSAITSRLKMTIALLEGCHSRIATIQDLLDL